MVEAKRQSFLEEVVLNDDYFEFTEQRPKTMSGVEKMQFMQEADEDLMRMDTQADEVLRLATIYEDYEELKIVADNTQSMSKQDAKNLLLNEAEKMRQSFYSSKSAASLEHNIIDSDQSPTGENVSSDENEEDPLFHAFNVEPKRTPIQIETPPVIQKSNTVQDKKTQNMIGNRESNRVARRIEGLKVKKKLKVNTYADIKREKEMQKLLKSNPLMYMMDKIDQELDDSILPEGLVQTLLACQQVKNQIFSDYVLNLMGDLKHIDIFDASEISLSKLNFQEFLEQDILRKKKEDKQISQSASSSQPNLQKELSSQDSTDTQSEEDEQKAENTQKELKTLDAQKFEVMLNSCLVQKVLEQDRFSQLKNLENRLYIISDNMYEKTFDSNKIKRMLHEIEQQAPKKKSQTSDQSPPKQPPQGQESTLPSSDPGLIEDAQNFLVETLISNFVSYNDSVFKQKYIDEPLCDIFYQEINPVPEFFVTHYQYKVWTRLRDKINGFRSGFVSTIEENWQIFITEEKKNLQFFEDKVLYQPKELDADILQAAFEVIGVLPMRKQVKHDLELVQTKVQNAKKNLSLSLDPQPTWDYKPEQMLKRRLRLKEIISDKCSEDYVTIIQTVHKLMFTLFNAFINSKHYDAKDRHMLKLFLEEMTPVFQELMHLKPNVNLHYLLQTFERMFGERVPKDKYDIKQMASLFGDELLETLKIKSSMGRCVVLELTRVSRDLELKSKHCVIAISGFLQQNEDKRDTWANVATFYKNAEVYALTWTACNSTDFFDKGIFDESKVTSFQKLLNTANLFSTANRQYIFAYDQARLSGSLLAIFLLKSNFTEGRVINLIGFSLGSVVALNCIRVLKFMYRNGYVKAGRILHDVQLWAGAYVIDPKKTYNERMRCAFHCSVVNGTLTNCFSYKDNVIKYLQPKMQPGTRAIGGYEILLDVPEDEDGSMGCKKPINFDCSETAGDHSYFTIRCGNFLPHVPFNY